VQSADLGGLCNHTSEAAELDLLGSPDLLVGFYHHHRGLPTLAPIGSENDRNATTWPGVGAFYSG